MCKKSHDFAILATGFSNIGDKTELPHPLLNNIKNIYIRENGAVHIERNYRITPVFEENKDLLVYLNGLCERTHGIGDAGSFSLVSLRAKVIADELFRNMQ